MIRVKFNLPPDPQQLAAWNQWLIDAETAAGQLLEDYKAKKPVKVNSKLYKTMRKAIFGGYYNKCAYCEARFRLTQTGDVEHFRPKKGLRDEQNQKVSRPQGTQKERHPGYFWLAYHWQNLLPSCSKCNRLEKVAGRTVGKGERFPVAKGVYAWVPAEVAREKPLFIHPGRENPAKHIVFDKDTGLLLAARGSQRGKQCIELLDLNREDLQLERQAIYDNVILYLKAAIECLSQNRLAEYSKWLDRILAYKEGTAQYALAGRQALADRADLLNRLRQLGGF